MSNHTVTVTITDEDRSVDFELEVNFDFCPEEKATGPSYASGGEPGCPAHSEINSVRCLEVTTWCGDVAVSAKPANDNDKSLEKKIGEWCEQNFRSQIEDAVNEAYEIDTEPDWDAINDERRIRRLTA